MQKELNHYWVHSPEMEHIEPILEDGSGPMEYFCCCTSVKAPTKRDAILRSLRSPEMMEWVKYQRADGRNPFSGVKAESARCIHGVCSCEECNDECPICLAEHGYGSDS
jgi:hypothetical protein